MRARHEKYARERGASGRPTSENVTFSIMAVPLSFLAVNRVSPVAGRAAATAIAGSTDRPRYG